MVEGKLHVKARALTESSYVMLGIQDLDVGILLDIACRNLALAAAVNNDGLRTVGIELCGDALDVKNDFRDILFDSGNGRDFVKHTVYLYTRDRNAGKRAEQHSSQRISESSTVASFERFDYKGAGSSVFA